MRSSSAFPTILFAATVAITINTVGCKPHVAVRPADAPAGVTTKLSAGEIHLQNGESTAGSASASPYDGSETAALDVAGVKLGMTPEQAIAALKAYDSGLFFSKRYSDDPKTSYGAGQPDSCVKGPIRLFVGIKAAKGTTFLAGQKTEDYMRRDTGYYGCAEDSVLLPGDDGVLISVYLSPTPGNHRVIAVSLHEKFKSPRPVSSIVATIQQKYPKDITESDQNAQAQWFSWRYDPRMRLMAKAAALRGWQSSMNAYHVADFSSDGALPGMAYEGDGVAIDAAVDSTNENHELTNEFGVILYDEGALYRFNQDASQLFDALKSQKDNQELEHARQHDAPVKF